MQQRCDHKQMDRRDGMLGPARPFHAWVAAAPAWHTQQEAKWQGTAVAPLQGPPTKGRQGEKFCVPSSRSRHHQLACTPSTMTVDPAGKQMALLDSSPDAPGSTASTEMGLEDESLRKRGKISHGPKGAACSLLQMEGGNAFVATKEAEEALGHIKLLVDAAIPVLVVGPLGCGKSLLVEAFAHQEARQRPAHIDGPATGDGPNARDGPALLVMNVGEASDSKTLLGTYGSDPKNPGQFRYTPSVLVDAMVEGRWVLIEDLHVASPEYTAILRPILEERTIYATGGSRAAHPIRAHPDFRIFATASEAASGSAITHASCTKGSLTDSIGRLFGRVEVRALSIEAISTILSETFPSIAQCIPLIVRVYAAITGAAAESGEKPTPSLPSAPLLAAAGSGATMRNVVKLCRRLASASLPLLAIEPTDSRYVPEGEAPEDHVPYSIGIDVRQALLVEISDCFFGHLSLDERCSVLATHITAILQLADKDVAVLVRERKPHITLSDTSAAIGRASFATRPMTRPDRLRSMAPTRVSLQIMEKVAVSIKLNEPVLLVGETGTGKTTIVQHLATALGIPKLLVINLSQQSEVSDLLGGFRPLSLSVTARGLLERFEKLFEGSFSQSKNASYLAQTIAAFTERRWSRFTKFILQVVALALVRHAGQPDGAEQLAAWRALEEDMASFALQAKAGSAPGGGSAFFAFVTGALVEALENGYWILLDEINLASSETLEVLSSLLQSPRASIMLGERGDRKPIIRHSAFRLFACMNPATDVAKRNLPLGIATKMSHYYVDETDLFPEDISMIVSHCLAGTFGMTPVLCRAIVQVYYSLREAVREHKVVDGSRKRPLLNLRTLTRALHFATIAEPLYGAERAIYEGLLMTFTTVLDKDSQRHALALIGRILFGRDAALAPLSPAAPLVVARYGERFNLGKPLVIESYIVNAGPETVASEEELQGTFLLTPSVRANVANLARAVMARGHPILLEGPTSAGKTSVIEFLAMRTGHKFVRINNHEHTDVQEYIGSYQSDAQGKLAFCEGLLVKALRGGHWIVLDELNLAPSDVLEALNRLLDDNRELYVPELGEAIKAHPSFLLFATQNPAGVYGGRKVLSKAFRSRFIELQFGDIPIEEVEEIITRRCVIAPSHAKKISRVFAHLQERRTGSNIFAGRQSMVTLRDMFRWANRPMVTIQDLAGNGYMVLAERLRNHTERAFVQDAIESILKVKLDPEGTLYSLSTMAAERKWPIALERVLEESKELITWTKPMQRLFVLTYEALRSGEGVLLVGETGCGKTTVCQLLAKVLDISLVIVNCHQNTETSDLIGSLRPSRGTAEDSHDGPRGGSGPLFAWQDGPLVGCMRQGSLLLLDEISLADDSVLERFNSVLESGRSLTLAESVDGDFIKAHPSFALLATMNPGGDYGKKELSPALRNRFTEIWVPTIGDSEDLRMILADIVGPAMADRMVAFVEYWCEERARCHSLSRWPFSIRDVLCWAKFSRALGMEPWAVVHAAAALFVDPAKSIAQVLDSQVVDFIGACQVRLCDLFSFDLVSSMAALHHHSHHQAPSLYSSDGASFGIEPFMIPVRQGSSLDQLADGAAEFCFQSPTTMESLQRILRAARLSKSILLEGSPGVGKTSLIGAIAKATGHTLVRINLSEQTDIIDLFGTDMPSGDGSGTFTWIDGPFLRALKGGHWILLDELNLASQSVLEGLNACLDHRGQVFIPELDRTFDCSPQTRIFAAQNPVKQGGGRKGLPKSFLNRFVTVWIDPLLPADMVHILRQKAPLLDESIITRAVELNARIHQVVVERRLFGLRGAPWEFNLRDLFRWALLATASLSGADESGGSAPIEPAALLSTIYASRMRTAADRDAMRGLLAEAFPHVQSLTKATEYHFGPDGKRLHVGSLSIAIAHGRQTTVDLDILPSQLDAMEGLIACISQGWLAILSGAVGKSSVIKLLASLAGVSVISLSLSVDTDASDLLGSFEQSSRDDDLDELASRASLLCGGATVRREDLEKFFADRAGGRLLEGHWDAFERLQQDFSASRRSSGAAAFKWHDGPLIRALEEGHWIVLDNANQCNPSVLDRLNSLFEPNGSIILSEAATVEPREVRPHPSFRIFMTCTGAGDLSRAMRNRGLEICLLPGGVLEDFAVVRSAAAISDNSTAFPIVCKFPPSPSWHDLGKAGRLARSLVERGLPLDALLNLGRASGMMHEQPQDDHHLSLVSSAVSFWLDRKLAICGTFPGNLSAITRQAIDELWAKIECTNPVLAKDILTSHWLPSTEAAGSFDFVICNKDGAIVRQACDAGALHCIDTPSSEQQAIAHMPTDKEWRRFWKTSLVALVKTLQTARSLLERIASMPVTAGMGGKIVGLLQQHAEARSLSGGALDSLRREAATAPWPPVLVGSPRSGDGSLEEGSAWKYTEETFHIVSMAIAGPLGEAIRKLEIVNFASSLEDMALRSSYVGAAHYGGGSIAISRVIRETLNHLQRHVASLSVVHSECQARLCTLILSNACTLASDNGCDQPYADSFARLANLEVELALRVASMAAGTLPQAAASLPADSPTWRRLVWAGATQLRSLVSLYRSDPVRCHYVPKELHLGSIVDLNKDLVKCQQVLRVHLFGDETIPRALEGIIQRMAAKHAQIAGRNALFASISGRTEAIHSAALLVEGGNILAAGGALDAALSSKGASMHTLLQNFYIVKERLAGCTSEASLAQSHAVNIIILGLELAEAWDAQEGSPQPALALVREDGTTSSSALLRNSASSLTSEAEAIKLFETFLTYKLAEQSLGYTPREAGDGSGPLEDGGGSVGQISDLLYLLYEREHGRTVEQEASTAMQTFTGENEEQEEESIARDLFSEPSKEDEALAKAKGTNIASAVERIIELFNCAYGHAKATRESPEDALARLVMTITMDGSVRNLVEYAYSLDLSKGKAPSARARLNVYREGLHSEAVAGLATVRALERRLAVLLEEYPEHDVLQSLSKMCHRFALLPAASPLLSLLTALELLLQRAQTWQNYADRMHSIVPELDAITALIIKWRRLELEGWRQILDAVDGRYKKGAQAKFLWLCQVTSKDYFEEHHIGSLVGLLDTFLLSGPLGEFAHRLRMLQEAQYYPTCTPTALSALKIVALYYAAIEASLAKEHGNHRRAIASDLKASLVSIMWNDKTYWSVKQTVEKSHRLVARQVRKYRLFLDKPVSIHLSNGGGARGASTLALTNDGSKESPKSEDRRLLDNYKGRSLLFAWRLPRAVSQPSPLMTRAFNRLGEVLRSIDAAYPPDAIDNLSRYIMETLDELSAETGKDGVQMKQKGYVDLVKMLKALGLRIAAPYKTEEALVCNMLGAAAVYAPSEAAAALLDAPSGPAGENFDSSGEEYLVRSLAAWQQIYNPALAIHEDLGVRQVEAARNSMFHLLQTGIKQRQGMAGYTAKLAQLSEMSGALQRRSALIEALPLSRDAVVGALQSIAITLLQVNQAKELIKPYLVYASPDVATINGRLCRLAHLLAAIEENLVRSSKESHAVFWGEKAMLLQTNEMLEEVGAIVLPLYPPLDDLTRPIQRRIRAKVRLEVLSEIEYCSLEGARGLQLAVQDIEALVCAAGEDDSWRMKARDDFGLCPDYLKAIPSLAKRWSIDTLLEESIRATEPFMTRAFLSREHLAECAHLAAIVTAFFASLHRRLSYQHRSVAKLSLIVTGTFGRLFKEGFCRPPEAGSGEEGPSDANGAQGSLPQDGTGMADGAEGEKNVSGEIEFEEQITDLMNNNTEEDGGDEGAQCGDEERIEMTADFDASIDDTPQEDGDDPSAEQEEQDRDLEEKAEDKMGDTGPDGDLQQLDDGWNNKDEEESPEDNNGKEPEKPEEYEPQLKEPPPSKGERKDQGKPAADELESDKVDPKNASNSDEMVPGRAEEEGPSSSGAEDEESLDGGSNELKDDDHRPEKELPDPMNDGEDVAAEEDVDAQRDDKDAPPPSGENSVSEEEEAADGDDMMDDDAPIEPEEGSDDDGAKGKAAQDDDDRKDNKDMESSSPSDEESDTNEEVHTRQGENAHRGDQPRTDPSEAERIDGDTGKGDESRSSGADQSSNAMMASPSGTLDETISASASTAKRPHGGDNGQRAQPSLAEELFEKVARSMHEIIQKSKEEMAARPEAGGRAEEKSPSAEQLFEETAEGATFAAGAAADHGLLPVDLDEEAPDAMDVDGDESGDDSTTGMMVDKEEELPRETVRGSKEAPATRHEEGSDGTTPAKAPPSSAADGPARPTWEQLEAHTADISMDLCEQLRLVLDPTLASKMRGDYRTGKRLNLRKIPAYIASEYRRDKIWLRRTRPNQRTYRIAISIDNSRSMNGVVGALALEALATIAQAMSKLEVGQLSVVGFGAEATCLHGLAQPWMGGDAAQAIIDQLRFDEEHTDVAKMLALLNDDHFVPDARAAPWHLNLILSDGICHDHQALTRLINAGLEKRIINVFIILDPAVCDISHVQYAPGGAIKMTKYLETFPFQFYLVLRDLKQLPTILADAIRQWFEMLSALD